MGMRLAKGRATAAPTLDSLVQAWYEGDDLEVSAMGRDQRQVRFDMNIWMRPILCEGKGRKTPIRGSRLVSREGSSLNTIGEVIENKGVGDKKICFGDGIFEVGTLARGARWADAEDDSLRTHSCALDPVSRNRPAAAAAVAIDRLLMSIEVSKKRLRRK